MDQIRRWRDRADELRAQAEAFKSVSAKEKMLVAADSLDRLAAEREVWIKKLAGLTTHELLQSAKASRQPANPESPERGPEQQGPSA
jgi:hypothetical protein